MNKILQYIVVGWGGILFSTTSFGTSDILLQQDNITVTVEDVERYIVDNTPEAKRESILNRNGIFKEMAENIYLIRRIGGEAEKDKSLDWEQLTWTNDLAKKRLAMAVFMKKLVKQQLESVNWEALAKETYLAESEQYQIPEKVRVSHVLITTDERTDEAAQVLIGEIKQKVLADEDFSVLAKRYSEDASVERNGGDVGLFARGQMVQPFEEAAFAMTKEGELSDIVKSKFGYHLIQFHQREATRKQDFAKVKQQIILQLKQSRANQIRQDIMTGFRSEVALSLDEPALEALRKKYQSTIAMPEAEIKSSAE